MNWEINKRIEAIIIIRVARSKQKSFQIHILSNSNDPFYLNFLLHFLDKRVSVTNYYYSYRTYYTMRFYSKAFKKLFFNRWIPQTAHEETIRDCFFVPGLLINLAVLNGTKATTVLAAQYRREKHG